MQNLFLNVFCAVLGNGSFRDECKEPQVKPLTFKSFSLIGHNYFHVQHLVVYSHFYLHAKSWPTIKDLVWIICIFNLENASNQIRRLKKNELN